MTDIMSDAIRETPTEFVSTPFGTVIEHLWDGEGSSRAEVEEACGVTQVCRNMKHVNFDPHELGAEPGADLKSVWKEKLRREGKLPQGSTTLGDLILGGRGGAS